MPRSIWSEPLTAFSDSVAATRPAPAGVAAAAVAAELGISLFIKTLAITGGQRDLLDAARRQAAQLRGAADDDIGAVMELMRAKDAAAVRQAIEAPLRAARAVVAAPVYAAPHVYAAPVVAAPVYAAPACVQVVNAYGQLATVCR